MDLVLRFDGACWPNPGGSRAYGYGWLVLENGLLIRNGRGVIDTDDPRTNNTAEFYGLIHGLRFVQTLAPETLLIQGDSQLIIGLVSGKMKTKMFHLEQLRRVCIFLLNSMKCEWRAEWIPREMNKEADELSSQRP